MNVGKKFLILGLFALLGACIPVQGELEPQTNVLGTPSMFVSNSNNPLYIRKAQFVGKALIDNRGSSGWTSTENCTATQIGGGYFVSAEHCFDSFSVASTISFNALDSSGGSDHSVLLNRMRVVGSEHGYPLDLIYGRIKGTPSTPAPEFPARWPRSGEHIYILHFPDNGVMHVSEMSCRVVTVEGPYLYHNCPTSKGSSGALIFAKDDNAVIGVHSQGFSGLRQGGGNNKATSFMLLLAGAPELRKFIPAYEASLIAGTVYGELESTNLLAASFSNQPPPTPPTPYPANLERKLAANKKSKSVVASSSGDTVVSWHSRFQSDCSFVIPRIGFRTLPVSGRIRAEVVETRFGAEDAPPESNSATKCRGKPLRYVQIIYTASQQLDRTESVSYDRVTGDRFDVRATLNLTFKNSNEVSKFPW